MRNARTGYAPINGLQMYYEVHGEGEPLIALHGAYMTVDAMNEIVSTLAKTRKVIAVELQAHGRTADIERPITYEHMADDVAAFLEHLDLDEADVFGYSMGGGVALQLALRYPGVVRRLVVVSASYSHGGMQPELIEMIPTITPEVFTGSPLEAGYKSVAPRPEDFPKLVEKLKQLDMTPFEWDVSAITSPTLLVVGDSDAIRLEHAVEFFRLIGGGVAGDLVGLPASRLAVLPGTSHYIPPGSGILDRADLLAPMVGEFLDAPLQEAGE
jgi:pimeloyl-ACP methyl ester carboxylesterase